MMTWFWVMIGGGLGAAARYGMASVIHTPSLGDFPSTTLTVNLVGCFAIGFAATLLDPFEPANSTLRLAVLTGFLGGFTTFSSFGLETVKLVQSGQHGSALGYVLLRNIGGLCLVGAGMWVAHLVGERV